MQSFDVVVIGGGPGGLSAGMMLSMMGKSVAIVQSEEMAFGGTCLNIGCMPTKALLKAASVYRNASHAAVYGLDIDVKPVDLAKVRSVVDADLNKLRGAIKNMMSMAPSMKAFVGMGSLASATEVKISKADGTSETISGEKIILAVGSEPAALPFAPFDEKYILSSNDMLKNTELPDKLLIVGGGAIGCEFATLYSSFGSRVTVVEALETLLPKEDKEAGQSLGAAFAAQGIDVRTGTVIENITVENGQAAVKFKGNDNKEYFDKVLVGVGRKPRTAGLNLEAAGVATDKGFVKVNEYLRTSAENIFASGDIIGGNLLAHAADTESETLVANILGKKAALDEKAVPRLAYCHPEVAAVGVSGVADGIKSFVMPQVPNGRSIVDKTGPAFVKLFVYEKTNVLAGAIIIGEAATEIIHEIALAVQNGLTLDSVKHTVHAHPTHSKNILKAVQMFK